MATPALEVDVDPGEVGFSTERLARIDRHLQRYVDSGRLPGYLVAVTRYGRVAHVSGAGYVDVERRRPVRADSLFRIYSMTKPVTSVAAMMLYEQGLFRLSTEVSSFIPSFADMRVYAGGTADDVRTVPATEPIRLHHLLTHTSGLSYGWYRMNPVDELYRRAGHEYSSPEGCTLAEACDDWAALPLQFQPGSGWHYSVATDVLGRIVEVVSGTSLGEFFDEHLFGPLGMGETSFGVGADRSDRLGRLYTARPDGSFVPDDELGAIPIGGKRLFGGGGLISSAHDYHRFTQMLRRGGELDGVRLLSDRTLAYMTRNHLPGGADVPGFSGVACEEANLPGVGFGLGFSVVVDPIRTRDPGNAGEYGWGGAASTIFWIDPVEQTTLLFFTQLMPDTALPLRAELRQLVSQALVGR